MRTKLHFCCYSRRYAIGLVDAYVAGFSERILPAYGDIEKEADAAAEAYFNEGLNAAAGIDELEMEYDEFEERVYESSQGHGERVYSDLEFVRRQVTGLAIAGLYHLWERLLKEFLRRQRAEEEEKIHAAEFDKLVKLLAQYGWNVGKEEFYADLNTLRLIANAVKHGDGKSCDKLLATAPDLFMDFGGPFLNDRRGASDMRLDPVHFDRFAAATRSFFQLFPARLPFD